MNGAGARRLAVDLPSGLDCDTGTPSDPTIQAHHTCTFVAPKIGFANPAAAECLGQVHVVDIGAPRRLVEIRRNRLLSLNQKPETAYVDEERVEEEVAFARRLFADNGWPVIDVTRRSIEETAAAVIKLYTERQERPAATGTIPV